MHKHQAYVVLKDHDLPSDNPCKVGQIIYKKVGQDFGLCRDDESVEGEPFVFMTKDHLSGFTIQARKVRIATDRESPPIQRPDEKHIKAVCKIGQGHETCRYVAADQTGVACLKWTDMRHFLDTRVKDKLMVAMGDNCEGRSS